jgi:hypothetical protein
MVKIFGNRSIRFSFRKQPRHGRVKVMDDLDAPRHDGSESFSYSCGDFLDDSGRSKTTADTECSHSSVMELEEVVPKNPDKVAVVASDESTIDQKKHVRFSSVQVHAADSMIEDESESTTRPQARVSFSTVRIREYQIILSDNPSSPLGVPIGLGWDHDDEGVVLSVDGFEERPRRSRFEYQIPPADRFILLKQAGYSASEIKRARKEVDQARYGRQKTLETLRFTHIFEALEKVQRAVLNETTRKSEKRKERDYLKPYRPAASAASMRMAQLSDHLKANNLDIAL